MRHRISRLAVPLFALTAVLLAAGCGDFTDLVQLSSGLKKDFGQASVNLTNGSHLTVTFTNPPPAAASSEAQTARRVAEYVRDHYRKYGALEDVTVAFETHRQYGPVGYTRGNGSYTFTRADLGASRSGPAAPERSPLPH
jgi:hypothetical protein